MSFIWVIALDSAYWTGLLYNMVHVFKETIYNVDDIDGKIAI